MKSSIKIDLSTLLVPKEEFWVGILNIRAIIWIYFLTADRKGDRYGEMDHYQRTAERI